LNGNTLSAGLYVFFVYSFSIPERWRGTPFLLTVL
jgi:hypothetical protein